MSTPRVINERYKLVRPISDSPLTLILEHQLDAYPTDNHSSLLTVWEAIDQVLDTPARVLEIHFSHQDQVVLAAQNASNSTDKRFVKIREVIDAPNGCYVITDPAPSYTLAHILETKGNLQLETIFGEVAQALQQAHIQGVRHLSLQPSLVGIDIDTIKIDGLGILSVLLGDVLPHEDILSETKRDVHGLLKMLKIAQSQNIVPELDLEPKNTIALSQIIRKLFPWPSYDGKPIISYLQSYFRLQEHSLDRPLDAESPNFLDDISLSSTEQKNDDGNSANNIAKNENIKNPESPENLENPDFYPDDAEEYDTGVSSDTSESDSTILDSSAPITDPSESVSSDSLGLEESSDTQQGITPEQVKRKVQDALIEVNDNVVWGARKGLEGFMHSSQVAGAWITSKLALLRKKFSDSHKTRNSLDNLDNQELSPDLKNHKADPEGFSDVRTSSKLEPTSSFIPGNSSEPDTTSVIISPTDTSSTSSDPTEIFETSEPGKASSHKIASGTLSRKINPVPWVFGIGILLLVLGMVWGVKSLLAPGESVKLQPVATPTGRLELVPTPTEDLIPNTPPEISGVELWFPQGVDPNAQPNSLVTANAKRLPLLVDGNLNQVWRVVQTNRNAPSPQFGILISLKQATKVNAVQVNGDSTGGTLQWIAYNPGGNPESITIYSQNSFAPLTILRANTQLVTDKILLWVKQIPRDKRGAKQLYLKEISVR